MKNQKFFWFSVAMVATCFFILALAIDGQAKRNYYENLDQEFTATYKRVMEMNEGRFADLDKVQVGDIILFPSYWDENDTELREVGGVDANGKHDCIWRMVHREVYGDEEYFVYHRPVSQQENASKEEPALNLLPDSSNEKSQSKNLWWLAILPMIPLTVGGRKWWTKKHNPDSYPPVGRNLNNLEESEIISDIQNVFAEPGAKVLAIQRGTMWRSSGPDKINVLMKFGDGKDRNVWIRPGESVCKIQVQNFFGVKSFKYCRSACTNGMILDEFKLPKGWEFVPNQNIVVPEEVIPTTNAKTDIHEEESPTKAEAEKELPIMLIIISENSFKRPARCTQNKKRCRACAYSKNGRRFCGYKPKPKKTN